jgi:hypothetical protein
MYGAVEDLTLHITSSSLHILLLIKAQHTNGGNDPHSRSQYTSTSRIMTFAAKNVPGGSALGFHSQGAGFESTRPILSGILHGLTHSLQTNPAQQMWATSSMVSTPCRKRI